VFEKNCDNKNEISCNFSISILSTFLVQPRDTERRHWQRLKAVVDLHYQVIYPMPPTNQTVSKLCPMEKQTNVDHTNMES